MRSSRSAVTPSACDTESTSGTPLCSSRTVKSPLPSAVAVSASRATGRARRRDCHSATSPAIPIAADAASAMRMNAPRVRSVTTESGADARTAPTTFSPRVTGCATTSRLPMSRSRTSPRNASRTIESAWRGPAPAMRRPLRPYSPMTCAASCTRSTGPRRVGKLAGTSLDVSDALRSSRTTFSSRCRSLSVNASGTAKTPTPTAVTRTIHRRMRDLTAGVPSRVGGELEAIADAAQRGDPAGGRVVADGLAELPAQRRDVHVERLGRPEPVLVPHLRHDPLAGDGRSRMLHEEGEQVELARSELHLRAGHAQPAGVAVELDVA